MRFGRFLDFITTVINSENAHSKLIERKFRGYWKRTDKTETNERIRFREVLRLIEQSTFSAPRHPASSGEHDDLVVAVASGQIGGAAEGAAWLADASGAGRSPYD